MNLDSDRHSPLLYPNVADPRLGRAMSPQEEREKYLTRFALTPETAPTKPVFVVFGIDWHHTFFTPTIDQDGHAWIGKGKPRTFGKVDGGHAIMSPPVWASYDPALADYQNQGNTSQCVDYSHTYGMSLENKQRYQHGWLYQRCQTHYDRIAGPPPPYDGTEVRAADECMRAEGLLRQGETTPRKEDGISAYRWARNVEDVHAVRGTDVNLGYVELWNSWGTNWGWTGRVFIPNESMDWLLRQPYADCAVPTDR